MSFKIVQQSTFEAGGGVKYQVKLDIGLLYAGLIVHNNDAGNPFAIADLTAMQLKLNGTNYWPLSGLQLDEINKYQGLSATDGIDLLLPFGLEGMKDQRMREITYLNTGKKSPVNGKIISTLQLELTFANAVDLSFFALADEATDEGPGLVRRFGQYEKAASASNFVGVTNLDFGSLQWCYWRAIYSKPSAGAMTYQKLYSTDETIIGDQVPVAALNSANKFGGHVPGTYFDTVMDFTALNNAYPALARVSADGKVLPDTPNNSMLDTLPLEGKTVNLTTWNDATGGVTNNHILEAVGQIN